MKTYMLVLIVCLSSVRLMAQTKEIYFGTSLSRYYWTNSTEISHVSNFQPGGQIGIMWGTKDRNFLGRLKFFKPHVAMEYNYFGAQYVLRTDNSDHSELMEAHNVRLSLPVRLRIRTAASGNASFFGTIEPGANLMVYSQNSTHDFNIKPDPFHLYVNAGLGTSFHFDRSNIKKSRYYFSALTFSAAKHIPLTSLKFISTKNGILDQFYFNIGFRYSYLKAKKKGAWFG
jgi:hypothetical protein